MDGTLVDSTAISETVWREWAATAGVDPAPVLAQISIAILLCVVLPLRPARYDAHFWPGIDDQALVRMVLGTTALLLTTDSRLMEHGAIAYGAVASLLVPITLDKHGQFDFVIKKLELPLKPTRCMACGGELESVDKESVRERIPPRTLPWLDEYFLRRRCNRLYWEGTHWQRIRGRLGRLTFAEPPI